MKYNGVYLRFGVAVEKEGMDYFSDSREFVQMADDLDETELDCVIECLNEIMEDVLKYREKRYEHSENI